MASMDMAAITFGDMYFVRPPYSTEDVHFHELVHVVQWSTLGVREFLLTYALGIAQHGYAASPLEATAFELQARFQEGARLHSLSATIVRRAIEARETAAAVFSANGLKWG
jgi:hypothetical protein